MNGKTPMQGKLGSMEARGGAIVGRKEGSSDPFTNWHRDIANAWPLLHCEATLISAELLKERHKDEETSHEEADGHMVVLDFISKFYIKYYGDALEDRAGAMGAFQDLYDYIGQTPYGHEIHNMYTGIVTQAMACYLFTAKQMTIAIPKQIDDRAFELATAHTLLSCLKDETRRAVISEWKDCGMYPGNADVSTIVRQTEPYLEIITGMQKAQMKKN